MSQKMSDIATYDGLFDKKCLLFCIERKTLHKTANTIADKLIDTKNKPNGFGPNTNLSEKFTRCLS
jgi:hypothetical protein